MKFEDCSEYNILSNKEAVLLASLFVLKRIPWVRQISKYPST